MPGRDGPSVCQGRATALSRRAGEGATLSDRLGSQEWAGRRPGAAGGWRLGAGAQAWAPSPPGGAHWAHWTRENGGAWLCQALPLPTSVCSPTPGPPRGPGPGEAMSQLSTHMHSTQRELVPGTAEPKRRWNWGGGRGGPAHASMSGPHGSSQQDSTLAPGPDWVGEEEASRLQALGLEGTSGGPCAGFVSRPERP